MRTAHATKRGVLREVPSNFLTRILPQLRNARRHASPWRADVNISMRYSQLKEVMVARNS